MTIKQKPGNHPDPHDMSGGFDEGAPVGKPAPSHPAPEEDEEDAAIPGDFA